MSYTRRLYAFSIYILFIVHANVGFVATFEPLSTTAAVAGLSALSVAGISYIRCKLYECCNEEWVAVNITGLQHDFRNRLHGQHLVSDVVIRSVEGHFRNPNPSKALVLSLHGWTGCGKNFVSQMIASNVFKEGIVSKFVHLFVSSYHFSQPDSVERYKDQLREWVRGNVSECGRSMFIFDEMDKMPVGIIDAIKPFIDHHVSIDGVDYRKSMFIFLSNNGGDIITQKTYEHWKKGLVREDLKLFDMEQLLTLGAFNEKGGLWHSSLIDKSLVSAFIPFLPMERHHVKLCIVDDFRSKGRHVNENDPIVNEVADMLPYYPADSKLFVQSGCKRVSEKVDFAWNY